MDKNLEALLEHINSLHPQVGNHVWENKLKELASRCRQEENTDETKVPGAEGSNEA